MLEQPARRTSSVESEGASSALCAKPSSGPLITAMRNEMVWIQWSINVAGSPFTKMSTYSHWTWKEVLMILDAAEAGLKDARGSGRGTAARP